MKSKVKYSVLSWVLTVGIIAGLVVGLIASWGEPVAFYTILAILVFMLIPSLFFAPVSLSVDKDAIHVHSLFKKHSILMKEVINVERYRPLPGTIRTCASGGFMGYWGTFRDGVSKNYVGYWGDKDECFMVTLASGKKYLLGCKNPDTMLAYIQSQITSS